MISTPGLARAATRRAWRPRGRAGGRGSSAAPGRPGWCPYRRPRRNAKSSAPSTRGVAGAGAAARRLTSRSSVSRPAGIASREAEAALPGRPPRASPTCRWASPSLAVRRARRPPPSRAGARRRSGAGKPARRSGTGGPGPGATRRGPARAGRRACGCSGCGRARRARRKPGRPPRGGGSGDDGDPVRGGPHLHDPLAGGDQGQQTFGQRGRSVLPRRPPHMRRLPVSRTVCIRSAPEPDAELGTTGGAGLPEAEGRLRQARAAESASPWRSHHAFLRSRVSEELVRALRVFRQVVQR